MPTNQPASEMPSREQLEKWVFLCGRIVEQDAAEMAKWGLPKQGAPENNEFTKLAAFLRSPLLAQALAEHEAIAWIEENDQQVWRSPLRYSSALYRWFARDHSNVRGEADTLPEAVAALKARLEKDSTTTEEKENG